MEKTMTKMGTNQEMNMGQASQPELTSVEVELAKGITDEEVKAIFFNNTVLREPNYSLHQLNSRGKRYYYVYDEDEPVFYPSVTTILHSVMPENVNLTEWKLSLGKEAAQEFTMDRANHGSFVHGQIATLMITGKYNLDLLREALGKYAEREKLPASFVDLHEEEAKADIIAFAKWMRDYDVKPLAVEVALYSPSHGYAGMIDLVCTMRKYPIGDTRKKANDERITAIVDYKTGKKGFYDSYAIQLELYRQMWNENFPDLQINQIFNVAPKDWRKTAKKVPSYSFEEQTENPVLQRIPYYLGLYELEEQDSRKVVLMDGTIDLSEDVDERVNVVGLADLIKSHKSEGKVEEVSSEEAVKELFGEE